MKIIVNVILKKKKCNVDSSVWIKKIKKTERRSQKLHVHIYIVLVKRSLSTTENGQTIGLGSRAKCVQSIF